MFRRARPTGRDSFVEIRKTPNIADMQIRHYTQQPSALRTSTSTEARLAQIEGGGFVTRSMLKQALSYWTDDRESVGRAWPSLILVDLREVVGYEAECFPVAQQWLSRARHLGVRRVACVASSSVLRTAAHVATESSSIDLRIFEHETHARHWLLQAHPKRRNRALARPTARPPVAKQDQVK